MAYTNGYIPRDRLVLLASGTNEHGYWEHLLSPASAARHRALVARAKARTGRTLAMGPGYSAYRPYDNQVLARKLYGLGAALPGTSSHGGRWEDRETLAMDYANWAWVYANHGGQAAFFEDARAVGLAPGMIMRSRGYPDEPWHVIDLNPWSPVPATAGSTELLTEAPIENRDIVMRTIYDTDNTNDATRRAAVGELTFEVQGPAASARERKLWGDPEPVTSAEWDGILASVNKRRAQNGLDPLTGFRGEVGDEEFDYAALAAAIVTAGGTAPTAAQIAKAVNDDAAKRRQGWQ
ncbi:hypothetical protein [Microbacterium sp. 2FI]|uniref:hypothetical protein n=1 Tax=Microbacterium sp. 2FI TaxID=2502193 RepID=UPI0010F53C24|nr:hypothetical protein [Microbacterium sp. 2FI]